MRVLYIINNLGSGGAEKLLEETLPLLNKTNKVEADVLLLTDKNNVFQKNLEDNSIKVDTISLRKIYSPLNILKIKEYINNGNYDIVHTHLFPTQYWVAFAKKFIKSKDIKFVTTEHSNNNNRRNRYYLKGLERYIYSKYDAIICITKKVKENLIAWIEPDEKEQSKFLVVENGVNISKYCDAKPYRKAEIHESLNEQTKLITMVARFSEAKDQKTLIKAISKLQSDIHLLLIGEGNLKEENIEFAKELGVLKRIHFLGFRDDIDRVLKTSDIIVLSSHWEGLSLSSIEAMASGRPFIASRVSGLEEIVDGYGMLFNEGDFEELSRLIYELLNDESLYKEVSDRCSRRADDFSIDLMINELITVYSELLQE